jgi:hypothetical protein
VQDATPPPRRLERFAEAAFALLVAAGALRLLLEDLLQIRAPYQLEFGEGNILASSLRLAHGLTPYPLPAAQPPYVLSLYGPLLYAVMSLPLRWLGPSFALPRLVILLATLAITVLLVALLRHWTGSWRIALLFGVFYLSLAEVSLWSATLRGDPLAIALALGGLYLFARDERRWLLAALLFLAAILVKPTVVAAPAAVFLYLVWRRQWRPALGFFATMALLVFGSVAALQYATQGAFLFHILGTHPEHYELSHLLFLWGQIGRAQLVPMLLVAGFAIAALRRSEPSLPLLYLLTALLTTASAGMAGAASNHFLEWCAALCLGCGLAYHAAGRSPHRRLHVLRSVALLTITGCALLYSILITIAWDDPVEGPLDAIAGRLPYQQRLFPLLVAMPEDCGALQRYLAARHGDLMLSENTGAVLLAGKTLLVTDPYGYTQLVRNGGWSAAPVDDLVRRRAVAAVVLSHDISHLRALQTDRWPASTLDALKQNYRLDATFACPNGRAVYLPLAPR